LVARSVVAQPGEADARAAANRVQHLRAAVGTHDNLANHIVGGDINLRRPEQVAVSRPTLQERERVVVRAGDAQIERAVGRNGDGFSVLGFGQQPEGARPQQIAVRRVLDNRYAVERVILVDEPSRHDEVALRVGGGDLGQESARVGVQVESAPRDALRVRTGYQQNEFPNQQQSAHQVYYSTLSPMSRR
jgi:predicted RNA-binding protein YlqC (UPF0109 family)